MFIIQGYNMDTLTTLAIITIPILQLIYIFIQHFFYNKQLKEFKENIVSIETQLKDKSLVIGELQRYINRSDN